MKVLGSRPHVLVVDDDPTVCEALAALLVSRAYLVSKANSAAEALAFLASTPVELVILDIQLGPDEGLDVLKVIKKVSPAVYVIILTGRGYDEETWQAAHAIGAHGYLSKTLPPAQLLNEVDRWLKFKR